MQNNQTQSGSFIPKEGSANKARRHSNLGLFMLISLLILGLSVALFAGAYTYNYVLNRQISKECDGNGGACGLKQTVANTREQLGIDKIVRYSRLDKKMRVANELIDEHISLSPLLDTLEAMTLHTVRFTSFSYSAEGDLTLSGVAISYDDLAAQEKAMEKDPLIKAAVFSDLGLDSAGNVTFTANILPAKSLLTFNSNL